MLSKSSADGFCKPAHNVLKRVIKKKRSGTGCKPVPAQLTEAQYIHQLLAQVQQGLVEMAAAILKLETQTIDLYEHISEYGFNSIAFIEYANQLNDKYQLEITPAIFFEYPSINALSQFMLDKYQPRFLDYY